MRVNRNVNFIDLCFTMFHTLFERTDTPATAVYILAFVNENKKKTVSVC